MRALLGSTRAAALLAWAVAVQEVTEELLEGAARRELRYLRSGVATVGTGLGLLRAADVDHGGQELRREVREGVTGSAGVGGMRHDDRGDCRKANTLARAMARTVRRRISGLP